jgi:AmmeMemoRadiSam system protein B
LVSYKILAQYEDPKTAIIIGPNHTGIGSGISIMAKGEWETPLGRVRINEKIAEAIVQASSIIDIDDTAHQYEHSIEVQIPFLQYLFKDKISIVPISMMMQDIESSVEIATAIFKASNEGNMVIIASSDMTHYEKQLSAEQKDKIALDCIIKLDIEGLYKVIDTNNISMCGYGPIAVLMNYAQLSKVTEVRLEAYRTSGDVSKDYTSVVGYASVSFKK